MYWLDVQDYGKFKYWCWTQRFNRGEINLRKFIIFNSVPQISSCSEDQTRHGNINHSSVNSASTHSTTPGLLKPIKVFSPIIQSYFLGILDFGSCSRRPRDPSYG